MAKRHQYAKSYQKLTTVESQPVLLCKEFTRTKHVKNPQMILSRIKSAYENIREKINEYCLDSEEKREEAVYLAKNSWNRLEDVSNQGLKLILRGRQADEEFKNTCLNKTMNQSII